jgi:hypothetical protein
MNAGYPSTVTHEEPLGADGCYKPPTLVISNTRFWGHFTAPFTPHRRAH